MEQVILESGQVLQTHERGQCFGQWCAVHQPMPGPWAEWPRQWRQDRSIMERKCPHGVGHPVAEMYDFAVAQGRAYDLVHGCCRDCICSPRLAKREMEGGWVLGMADVEEAVSQPAIPEGVGTNTVVDALDLLVELWPRNGETTIMINERQWERLRRVLLFFPAMWTEVDRKS